LDAWTYCITPTNAKDWSCIATILKALVVDRAVVVAWEDEVAMTPAAVRFLESLPLTRVMMGYRTGVPPLLPDAILFSNDTTTARSLCERLPSRKGACVLPPADAWTELLRTLAQSHLSLLVTDVEDAAWTLYWYNPEDSSSLTAAQAKERVRVLLATAQQLVSVSFSS